MGLVFNPTGIKNNVKPKLATAKTKLSSCRNVLSEITIPTDFAYYNKLNGISNEISKIEKEITNINNWLDDKITEFINVENKNQQLLRELKLATAAGIKNRGTKIYETIKDFLKKDTIAKEKVFDVTTVSYLTSLDYEQASLLQSEMNDYISIIEEYDEIYNGIYETYKPYLKIFEEYKFCSDLSKIKKEVYANGVIKQIGFYELPYDEQLVLLKNIEKMKSNLFEKNKEKLAEIGVSNWEELENWINQKKIALNLLENLKISIIKKMEETPYTYLSLCDDYEELANGFNNYTDIKVNKNEITGEVMFLSLDDKVLSTDNINYLYLMYLRTQDSNFNMKIGEFSITNQNCKQYENVVEHMTDEQINNYNYLFAKSGKEEAEAYLKTLKDGINQKIGTQEAMEFLEKLNDHGNFMKILLVSGEGFKDGIDSFFQGLDNLFNSEGVYSASDYKQMIIMTSLMNELFDADTIQRLQNGELSEEEFKKICEEKGIKDTELGRQLAEYGGYEKFLSYVYKFGMSLGNMAPSILISMATSLMLSPAAGVGILAEKIPEITGCLLMGLSSAGNSINIGRINGLSDEASILYGLLSGTIEGGLEYFLGNIPGLSSTYKISLLAFLKEGGQEAIQQFVQEIVDAVFLGKEINLDEIIKNCGEAAAMGVIMSMFFGATGKIAEKTGQLAGIALLTYGGITKEFSLIELQQLAEKIKNGETTLAEAFGEKTNSEIDLDIPGKKTVGDINLKTAESNIKNTPIDFLKGKEGFINPSALKNIFKKGAKTEVDVNNSDAEAGIKYSNISENIVSFMSRYDAAKNYGDYKQMAFHALQQFFQNNKVDLSNNDKELYDLLYGRQKHFFKESDYFLEKAKQFLPNQIYNEIIAVKNDKNSPFSKIDNSLTESQKRVIAAWSAYGGNVINAWLRGQDYQTIFKVPVIDTYIKRILDAFEINKYIDSNNIGVADVIQFMDEFLATGTLENTTITYHGTDGLYYNGNKIDLHNVIVGQIFNNAGYTSVSVTQGDTSYQNNKDIVLTITLPKGTNGQYIEYYNGTPNGYSMQEFLLPRNSNFVITTPPVFKDGKIYVNAELII